MVFLLGGMLGYHNGGEQIPAQTISVRKFPQFDRRDECKSDRLLRSPSMGNLSGKQVYKDSSRAAVRDTYYIILPGALEVLCLFPMRMATIIFGCRIAWRWTQYWVDGLHEANDETGRTRAMADNQLNKFWNWRFSPEHLVTIPVTQRKRCPSNAEHYTLKIPKRQVYDRTWTLFNIISSTSISIKMQKHQNWTTVAFSYMMSSSTPLSLLARYNPKGSELLMSVLLPTGISMLRLLIQIDSKSKIFWRVRRSRPCK